MGNFVLAYRGGSGMSDDPAEREQAMAAWGAWFGQLGQAVVDAGAPFGSSSTVPNGGTANGSGAAALTGYSIVSAGSLDEATERAKGCPVLANGGTVDVYEALAM
jgi:hypothetical protein